MSRAQYEPTAQTPPPWPAQVPAQGRSPSRVLPILGAVLGTLGLIVGVAAWFRAAPPNVGEGPVYSEQQVADAKTAVCDAYAKGLQALQVAGAKKPDPTDWLPVAVNTRLAETAIGNFLINILDANPAVPPELRELTRQLALAYQSMALTQLADGQINDYKSDKDSIENLAPKIDQICQ